MVVYSNFVYFSLQNLDWYYPLISYGEQPYMHNFEKMDINAAFTIDAFDFDVESVTAFCSDAGLTLV